MSENQDGEIAEFLKRKLGPSYRTSLIGLLNAACVVVVAVGQALPQYVPSTVVTVATTVMGLLVSRGFMEAKDKRTTGAQ